MNKFKVIILFLLLAVLGLSISLTVVIINNNKNNTSIVDNNNNQSLVDATGTTTSPEKTSDSNITPSTNSTNSIEPSRSTNTTKTIEPSTGTSSTKAEESSTNNIVEKEFVSVEKFKSEGLVDTYVIHFSDGSTSSFTITNEASESSYDIFKKQYPDYDKSEDEWINEVIENTEKSKDTRVTVTFDYNDGTKVVEQKIECNTKVEEPEKPTKDGYLFDGWNLYDNKWNFQNLIDHDIDLKARWIENSFKVTTQANNNGGTYTIVDDNYKLDDIVSLDATALTGYEFDGWFDSNDNLLSSNNHFDYKVPSKDSVITAKFDIIKYEVNYVVPEGTINNNEKYFTEFSTITLSNPSLIGHTFLGWYLEEGHENKVTVLGNDKAPITVYAYFIENIYTMTLNGSFEFTITYNHNYEDSDDVIVSLYSGQTLEDYIPTRSGYLFIGWYKEEGCINRFNYNEEITSDLTLYAKWEEASGIVIDPKIYNSSSNYYTINYPTTRSVCFVSRDNNNQFTFRCKMYSSDMKPVGFVIHNETRNLSIAADSLNKPSVANNTYISYTITCNEGDVILITFTHTPQDSSYNQYRGYADFYFSNYEMSTSTAEVASSITREITYGALIDYSNPKKENMDFIGWYTDNDILFDLEYYYCDSNLVLTAKYE